MAGRKAAKQAPAKVDDDDDAEGWEDAVVEAEGKEEADLRLRDWRDVERYREMKELRRLVDDDYGLEEIFHIPLKPRAEPGIPAPRSGKLPRGALVPKVNSKAMPAPAVSVKAAAQKPAKAHARPAAAPKKPPAKLKAKAKRK